MPPCWCNPVTFAAPATAVASLRRASLGADSRRESGHRTAAIYRPKRVEGPPTFVCDPDGKTDGRLAAIRQPLSWDPGGLLPLGLAGSMVSAVRAFLQFLFKAHHAQEWGMPQWIARDDQLQEASVEAHWLGRHKYSTFGCGIAIACGLCPGDAVGFPLARPALSRAQRPSGPSSKATLRGTAITRQKSADS